MATTSTLTTVRTIDSAQGHSDPRKLTELIGHQGRGHQRDRPSLSAIAPLLAASWPQQASVARKDERSV